MLGDACLWWCVFCGACLGGACAWVVRFVVGSLLVGSVLVDGRFWGGEIFSAVSCWVVRFGVGSFFGG